MKKGVALIGLLIVAGAIVHWQRPDLTEPLLDRAQPGTEGTVLYRYRDGSGQWVVTSDPPTDKPYETLAYRGDENVVPAFSAENDD